MNAPSNAVVSLLSHQSTSFCALTNKKFLMFPPTFHVDRSHFYTVNPRVSHVICVIKTKLVFRSKPKRFINRTHKQECVINLVPPLIPFPHKLCFSSTTIFQISPSATINRLLNIILNKFKIFRG